MTDSLPSSEFYLRKAEELRRLAEAEVIPGVRNQHLRIASMYQALADHGGDRSPGPSEPVRRPTVSIPKGVVRPR